MVLPTDLVALSQVEEFLGLSPGNADEPRLLTMIHATSAHLMEICNRQFVLQYISEVRNGTGMEELMVLQPPIINVYSVNFSGSSVTLAASDSVSGVVWDTEKLSLRGGVSMFGTMPNYYQTRFPRGYRNIRINYLSGWQLPNQSTNDWQASTGYYPFATIQPTSHNPGNFIYGYQVRRSGGKATSGLTRPAAFAQTAGALTADGGVVWTNLGITAMPDALPYEFSQAAAELVALRYRQAARWGDTGTGLGPERVNYYMKDAMDSTMAIIESMKQRSPILP